MKKSRILAILFMCLALCACTGVAAAQREGISSPVAEVSARYGQDAQKILNSFYRTEREISWETLGGLSVTVSSLERMEEYSYDITGTDDHFLYFEEVAALLRQQTPFADICKESERRIREHDDSRETGAVGALYCDPADAYTAGLHVTEVNYDVGTGQFYAEKSWERGPVTALRLDDGLMKRLQDAGFKTDKTEAKSFYLGGYCRGVWFSDGETERFLLQSVTTQSGDAVCGGLCTREQLCAGLDAHGEYYAYHGSVLGSPICG